MTSACIFIALISIHLKMVSSTTPGPSSTPGTSEFTELPFTDPAILGCCVYQRVPGEKIGLDKNNKEIHPSTSHRQWPPGWTVHPPLGQGRTPPWVCVSGGTFWTKKLKNVAKIIFYKTRLHFPSDSCVYKKIGDSDPTNLYCFSSDGAYHYPVNEYFDQLINKPFV